MHFIPICQQEFNRKSLLFLENFNVKCPMRRVNKSNKEIGALYSFKVEIIFHILNEYFEDRFTG